MTYDAGTARFLTSSEETNGAWSLVELTEKPGYKTRIHRHNYTDETYYVLEGVVTAKNDDKTYELPAGSYIVIRAELRTRRGISEKFRSKFC